MENTAAFHHRMVSREGELSISGSVLNQKWDAPTGISRWQAPQAGGLAAFDHTRGYGLALTVLGRTVNQQGTLS